MPTVYEPRMVEDKIYKFWLDSGCFQARGDGSRVYSIVIPPPNVTGSLHMGHALNNTIQDVLVRWKRMQGYDTLWLPGCDHAGIATQIKVEEHLQKDEGLSRHDIGREAFLKKAWQWKESYHKRILEQLQCLGVSCDWSRERFTMDEGCSRAVREVFVSLFEEGFIYRGNYMINWCPRCSTALSDIEVEHEDVKGTLTYIRYPLLEGEGYITVATTRPETMLGDTAVAVNPSDKRYQHLVGKKVLLPLMEREIPIIADEYVDPSFGTGAVKITPAHDPNDFEVAVRHELPSIQVINNDGSMSEETGLYAGMDRLACRQKVVEDLKKLGLVEKVEEYEHAVGHCQRCKTAIEPLVSRQWFVKMKPLAEPALKAVIDKKISFVPSRFTKVYLTWLENVRDWCISRQIWWGHRIPAWYCECGEMIVARQDPTSCPVCGSKSLEQDPDVLDTWFSSALWPFSTLGWPGKTKELELFFPTSVLVTGYDIIYFWVARMVFMSPNFMTKIPFKDVYIHDLVRDAQGRKMSKSLGNGVDPLEVISKYGADTLRYTLITGQAPGNDQRFRFENVEAGRNFANKIWNASRFVLMNLEGIDPGPLSENLSRHEHWILDRYRKTVLEVTSFLEEYELGEAARRLYDFIWSDFCDWYIELSKIQIFGGSEQDKKRVLQVLHHVLRGTLKLLHPFMPFISEEIWQHLPGRGEESILATASWPIAEASPELEEKAQAFTHVMEVVKAIRFLRGEVALPPGKKTKVILRTSDEYASLLKEEEVVLKKLAFADQVIFLQEGEEKPEKALTALSGKVEVYLPLEGVVDIEGEIGRLQKELAEVEKDLMQVSRKLANPQFVQKAPPHVVRKNQDKQEDLTMHRQKLQERLQELTKLTR